jgi:dihydroflavonol-4-reductase
MLVVTGANGFLGSYVVCALLKKGFSVRALRREQSDMSEFNDIAERELGKDNNLLKEKLEWTYADITDIQGLDEAIAGAEYAFHCAAMVSFQGASDAMLKVNAEGTANVVNACLKAGVKKLVYASSTAALGRTDDEVVITEETQWSDDDNNTEYAKTKHLAEFEVWRGIEEGLNAVIVNPGIILGAGKWDKGSCKLFHNIAKGFRFYTRGVNGFVGVKDVAEAMLSLAQSNISAQRFLLVAENRTYQDIFRMIAEGLGKRPPGIEIRKSHVKWLKWPLMIYQAVKPGSTVTAETMRTSVKEHRYDNTKIQKAMGFKFTPIEEVVREVCVAYKGA